jgi:hypothetical protein
MWTTLTKPEHQRTTGVVPYCIRDVRAPERTLYERGDPKAPDYAQIDAPPNIIELGRAVAIAKSGAYGPRASDALLVLLASAQRRRPVAGMHRRDFCDFDDEVLWSMAPYFRKSAAKKRSRNSHLVPLVGCGAAAARRLDKAAGSNPWWLPVRWTKIDRDPKQPHANPNWITKLFKWMPGVGFSPHGARAALASYGSEHLGWAKDEDKIILDHMEGFDPGDVTAQHYNSAPQIVRKRQMMRQSPFP